MKLNNDYITWKPVDDLESFKTCVETEELILTKIAIDLIEEKYVGKTRCDKITKYTTHLYEVAHLVAIEYNFYFECPDRAILDRIISIALLHDIVEDEIITIEKLQKFIDDKYVINRIQLLNENNYDSFESYMRHMNDFVTLMIKGCDRISNLRHMNEGFSLRKQFRYICETFIFVLEKLEEYKQSVSMLKEEKYILSSICETLRKICKVSYEEAVLKLKEETN